MTLQQLTYFIAALDHGSFSAAAEELHLAQPSLSEQIRRLEAELGVALFTRVGRGVVPTEAGQTLRPHAERVLADLEAARESVVSVRELRGGVAAFGTWGTARYYPITEIVADFRRRHPNVRVRLVGQNSALTAEAVRTGELEAGMVALPIDDRGLDVRIVMRDELVYASTDPARVAEPMTVERLAGAPLIMPDSSYGNEDPTRRLLVGLVQQAGGRIEPVIDVEDVEASVDLAGQGFGDTVVARGIILGLEDRIPRALGWTPFDPPLHDHMAFVSRRGAALSPATREFLGLAEERLLAHAKVLRTKPPRTRRPRR